ncbi:NAD(P)-binding protein [Aspergillus heteromorphus CBS 117.55]|uniref:NAD(P)-binding protein n=1 Tax=Aspergillus heteromorphus CBS 117.55 TaxID=1448321 RepID=A0A317VYT0_9EURO|nr:NAD(P)-binding protein [Aspergillus heteromorphus CBS 117.55]PWY77050.1 NAD(P)-binding protein [Aspergillus heteromorphus CBS 117.55]
MPGLLSAVTLLGAGTQGTRLAFMWSRLGKPVYLVDKNPAQLTQAKREIDVLRKSAVAGPPSQWGDIICAPANELSTSVAKSWLVVECVPESLGLKRSILQQLGDRAGPDTIIASNSSSYDIVEIMRGLEVNHPENFVSLHSYWPPETPAIEIMGSTQTPSETISLLMQQTKAHGFDPFHVKRPSTGYIYNRIWAAIKRESLLTLSEGVATPAEIDGIFKSVLKTPKGPCEQMDVVGLDVVLDIEKHYAELRPGLPEEPRKLLQEMIRKGQLGVKSGTGFFEHGDGGKRE